MRSIYLDYAATTPMDERAVQAMLPYMTQQFGNPSSLHSFGRAARQAAAAARGKVAALLGARPEEIFFTSGGSESDNWALRGLAEANRERGRHIITTAVEHHAVLHTCRRLEQQGWRVTYLPVDREGRVSLASLRAAAAADTVLISVMLANNEVGTLQPVAELATFAKERGILFHTDAVQAAGHIPIDVRSLPVDALSLSGHKLYGPTGIGVLYVKEDILQAMPPWEGGGSMIATVSLSEGTTYARAPWRFEAGTPNTGGIIGLGAALSYVSSIGLEAIQEYEQMLMHYALQELASVPELTLYGPANRQGVIAFNLGKHHAYDVGSFLDNYGVAVRTGHHCAMPLMAFYQVPAMCRASLVMYNTTEEVDRLVAGLKRIHQLLG